MPGPGWYLIDDAEEAEVLDALRERVLSRYRFADPHAESKTMALERHLAGVLDCAHVLALNSCTSALLAGLYALDIGAGDEVLVPGYTFIASIAVVVLAGARPVLVEVDESLTMDPADAAAKITGRTAAIMPVHMLGAPARMDALAALAHEHGLALLEDCAQACGGSFHGRRLGTWGDVGAFSLNTGKTITAGDGGVLCTDREDVYRRAFAFHDHGFAPDRAGVLDAGAGIGLNLRLHELAAALGLAQARKLDTILARCRTSKAVLRNGLAGLPGVRERVVHDAAGDCATTHTLIFDDPAVARRVAAELGGGPLADSPKHNYARMARLHPVLAGPAVAHGAPGALPRTDDILSRAVSLSVGVVDGYLGTLGDITVLDPPATVTAKAGRIRTVVERTAGTRA